MELSRNLLAINPTKKQLPIKVLQFGEGNFLRAFVDDMLDMLNAEGLFNGAITVVQPIEQGMVDMLQKQDGLYTLLLRGLEDGKVVNKERIVTSITEAVNPFKDFDTYINYAKCETLRFVVSNTTEAGITYVKENYTPDRPQTTFPAKVTAFLYERFKHFNGDKSKALVFIPCELIDYNGTQLKKCVKSYAEDWNLGADFDEWLSANCFTNTLVDRIVTGYPRDEAEELNKRFGYVDNLIDTGEIFHFWVIECEKGFDMDKLSEELPFTKLGMNVVWTDDATPYKLRKVRILNGAHTMSVLKAYLSGKNTVGEMMEDERFNNFLRQGIFNEIIPTLDLPESDLTSFANAVFDRFKNPYIKHYLLSIALNSVSKFRVRVLPSILEYKNRKGSLPDNLTAALAALIAFYRGTEIRDNALICNRNGEEYKAQEDLSVLEAFAVAWKTYDSDKNQDALVNTILSNKDFWGTDLTTVEGFSEKVCISLKEYLK